jgi:hypothetical protein
MKLTKRQIIDETVEYYKHNHRASTWWGCQYLTEDGSMCAVGRCLEDPEALEEAILQQEGAQSELNLKGIMDFENLAKHIVFKPEYEGHCVEFWADLQKLHDLSSHWNDDKTLSEKGQEFKQILYGRWG